MAWTVEFDPQAEKELDRLDSQQAKRILKYLFERIATDEDPRRFGAPLRSNLAGLWNIEWAITALFAISRMKFFSSWWYASDTPQGLQVNGIKHQARQ